MATNGLFTSLAFLPLTRLKPEPKFAKPAAYPLGVTKSGAIWVGLHFIPFALLLNEHNFGLNHNILTLKHGSPALNDDFLTLKHGFLTLKNIVS